MLKTDGEWEKLSNNERLLLLGVAHQLQKIEGLRVPFEEARASSGISEEDFEPTLRKLYMKGLITHNNSGVILIDDAASDELLGVKSAENEARLASALQEQLKLTFV